ncbi:MAG: hypothetical protein ACTTH5_05380 [Wolinella sp.]
MIARQAFAGRTSIASDVGMTWGVKLGGIYEISARHELDFG